MINLGEAARLVRAKLQISQRNAADQLGISYVHLSNIENGHSAPSDEMVEKYYRTFGVDLYMLAVAFFSDEKRIPEPLKEPLASLRSSWQKQLDETLGQ